MQYNILFSDVDGTLIPFGSTRPSPAVVRQLAHLKQQGVKLVVATGRGPAHIHPDFLGGIQPDYTITFNGACILDGERKVLFANPMDEAQFAAIEAIGKQGHAVGYSFDDGYYLYHNADKLVTLSGATVQKPGSLPLFHDTSRHTRGMPYVAFCNYPDELAEAFNRQNPSLKLVYHRPNTYDLCQSAHNKATAAAWLLSHLGLDAASAVAIGDAGNDVELLALAGLGIAMGNAPAFVREMADRVAPPVEEDGAATALQEAFAVVV